MREERRRKLLLEEKLAARRECPVPKPGGLIGQVLGVQKEGEDEEQQLSIVQRVEKTICHPWGRSDNQ